MKAQRNKFQ